MPQESRIEALIGRWHELVAAGKPVEASILCRSSPELLAEIRRRLDQIERVGSPTLTGPVNEDGASPTLPSAATAQESGIFPVGYECLAELGRGGMGVVYMARHAALSRVVALKMILSGGHASAEEQARFLREAETVARLQHPGIVQIFEVGAHAGRPYLSLEYCAGGGLDRKLDGTPMPPREAAALVEKVSRAVQAAHAAGIVHRDIKPANVLLAEDGTPKISDFGLARPLDDRGLTATGAVLGTPSYMPPEQALGERSVGPAADVYSLGAVLYECLTGRPPFRAATTYDTLLQVANDDAIPPSRLNPSVPRDLETITLKCLSKRPGRRYASAADLGDDLGRWLRGEPILARPAGASERAVRWAVRNPAVASLSATVIALTAAALVAISALYASAVAAADTARQQRDRAITAEQKADGLLARANGRLASARYADSLFRALKDPDPLRAAESLKKIPGGQRGWEYRQALLQVIARNLPDDGPVEAVAWSEDGRTVVSAGPGKRHCVWEAGTGRQTLSSRTPTIPRAAACSPDGAFILDTGNRNRGEDLDEDAIETVRMEAAGTKLRAGEVRHRAIKRSPTSKLKFVPLKGGTPGETPLPADAAGVLYVDAGQAALVLSEDGQLLHLTRKGKEAVTRKLLHLKAKMHGLASAGSNGLLACLTPNRIALVQTKGWNVRHWLTADEGSDLNSASFSPDGSRLAAADTASGKVVIWDAASGKRLSEFSAAGGPGRLTAVSWLAGPVGTLATADRLDGVTIRDGDGRALAKHPFNCTGGDALAPSPDGKFLAVGVPGGIRLIPLGGGEARSLDANEFLSRIGNAGPLGARTSISIAPGRVDPPQGLDAPEVWGLKHEGLSGRQLLVMAGDHYRKATSPDGRLRAAVSENMIELHDGNSDEPIDTLHGHSGPVNCICFGPNGRLFSTSDQELKVWSSDVGYPLFTWEGNYADVRGIVFDEALDCLILIRADTAELLFASKREK